MKFTEVKKIEGGVQVTFSDAMNRPVQLIEAAPELLEALSAIYNSPDIYKAMGCVYPPKVEKLMIEAHKAISKAKGE